MGETGGNCQWLDLRGPVWNYRLLFGVLFVVKEIRG